MTPLPTLAIEIQNAHTAWLGVFTSALDHARHAGELLNEAKEQLSHGQWLPWLAENCPDLSPRVAQGYMRIAARWPELQMRNGVSYLPIRDALAILADSYTDPDELGGNDDADDDDDDDSEDDEDDTDDADDDTPHVRMFQVYFSVEQHKFFKKCLRELRPVCDTANDTDTVFEVVIRYHADQMADDESTNANNLVDDPRLEFRQ